MARSKNKIIYVQASELKVHPTAQRRFVPAQEKRLFANFDLDSLGTLHVVADAEGQQWIIDGQHRWTSLMRHGLGEWQVRCELHADVIAEDHARCSELFLMLNTRAPVAPFDIFMNEVEAKNPIAVGAKRIAEKFGLKVDRQTHDGHITCVATMKKIFAIDEGATSEGVFAMAMRAHGLTQASVEGKYLEGLSLVFRYYNGEIAQDVLAKKLAKYPGGASGIIGDAKGLTRIRRSSLPKCVGEVILESYNSGRREENRLAIPWNR